MNRIRARHRSAIIIMSKVSAPTVIMAMITHTAITTVMARTSMNDYVRDPAEITRLSFAAIRREADLSALPEDIVPLALRMIHACGMTDLPADLAFSNGAGTAGRAALAAGAPILTDVEMVAHGIAARRLPAKNKVTCMLGEAGVPARAREAGSTVGDGGFLSQLRVATGFEAVGPKYGGYMHTYTF